MDVNEKRKLIQKLLEEVETARIQNPSASRTNPWLSPDEYSRAHSHIYTALEDMNDIKYNYGDYFLTEDFDFDEELARVPTANYELCTAILTMFLAEDRFCEGFFDDCLKDGHVKLVLERMLEVLA